jgi:hypothetical protein
MRVYTGMDLSRKRLDWGMPAVLTERSSTRALCPLISMASRGLCSDWAMVMLSPWSRR